MIDYADELLKRWLDVLCAQVPDLDLFDSTPTWGSKTTAASASRASSGLRRWIWSAAAMLYSGRRNPTATRRRTAVQPIGRRARG
jgi:hypothetical protein